MMKKVARRLKFWSRKTKRKKSKTTLLVAPSFPCNDYLDSRYSPSAPPLPPWVEVDYDCQCRSHHRFPFQTSPDPVLCDGNDIIPILPPIRLESQERYSYMEYESTGPRPVTAYRVPSNAAEGGNAGRGTAGLFGCLVRVGLNVFGCLFPCLSIGDRDAPAARRRAIDY